MTPTYDLVPGDRVGVFRLGDSLWHILEILRTDKVMYPKVEVSWDQSQPHKAPVIIHLPHLTLYFPHSPTQSLGQITLDNLGTISLNYETHMLCSPSSGQILARGVVSKVLGPTYDHNTGSSGPGSGGGQMIYPGIAFHFGDGIRGTREDKVDKVVITPKEREIITRGIRRCVLQPGKGAILYLPEPVEIVIGHTTSQELHLDLGSPIRRFYKEDERMSKMWGGQASQEESDTDSYFLNYFQYGLDFLISSDGVVQKIIAYSNIPGTPLFQRYARCPWSILSPSGELDHTSPISSFHTAYPSPASHTQSGLTTQEHLVIPSGSGSGKKSKKRTGSATSSTSTTSDQSGKDGTTVEAIEPVRGGMVLDRIGESGLEGVQGDMRSRLIGFDGMVIEEAMDSGGICSVLIYRVM